MFKEVAGANNRIMAMGPITPAVTVNAMTMRVNCSMARYVVVANVEFALVGNVVVVMVFLVLIVP